MIGKAKEMFWLKWIHAYYIKGSFVFDIRIPITTTWMTRKLLSIRDEVRGSWDPFCDKGKFSMHRAYSHIL